MFPPNNGSRLPKGRGWSASPSVDRPFEFTLRSDVHTVATPPAIESESRKYMRTRQKSGRITVYYGPLALVQPRKLFFISRSASMIADSVVLFVALL